MQLTVSNWSGGVRKTHYLTLHKGIEVKVFRMPQGDQDTSNAVYWYGIADD
ncbi:MAG: hypothetical protein ACRD4F_04840 [Candidatus Angelobacter sp.]